MTVPLIIDPEAIENLRSLSPDDNDAFLKEILTIFLDDTPQRIAELHRFRSSGDTTAFVRSAHSIKGSSSNVGAAELRALAEQLEHRARQNGTEQMGEHVAALEAAFLRAKARIDQILAA